MLFASLFQKAWQPAAAGPSRGTISPPLGSSQWVFFYLFPPVGASQAREFQVATTTTSRKTVQTTFCTVICIVFPQNPPNPVFFEVCLHVFAMFSFKHGNLHICHQKSVSKHHFLPCVQFPYTAIYTVFFNFSMCQCRWPTQTYIQKNPSKTLFFTVFLQCFPAENTVIYTFSAQSRSKTLVFAVFSMLWHPKKTFYSLISPKP